MPPSGDKRVPPPRNLESTPLVEATESTPTPYPPQSEAAGEQSPPPPSPPAESSPRPVPVRHIPWRFALAFVLLFAILSLEFRGQAPIDFFPLYMVGHLWRTGGPAWYYDYDIRKGEDWFLVEPPAYVKSYAVQLGYDPSYFVQLYLYFPAFIPVFSLFSLVSYPVAGMIMMALSLLALMLVFRHGIATGLSPPRRWIAWGVAVLLLLFSGPASAAFGWGQITPLLLAGACLALYWQRTGRPIAAGILLAVLAWCKLFPAVLILCWLVRKDFRAVIAFVAASALLLVVAYALFGTHVMASYFELLRIRSRGVIIAPTDQSIEAVILRFFHPLTEIFRMEDRLAPVGVKLASLVFRAALLFSWVPLALGAASSRSTAASRPARLDRFLDFYLLAASAMLLSLSWNHYFLFFIPLGFEILNSILESAPRPRAGFVSLFILAMGLTFLPTHWIRILGNGIRAVAGNAFYNPAVRVLFSCYFVGGLILLALTWIRLYKTIRPPDTQSQIVEL